MQRKVLHVTTVHGPYDNRIFQKKARLLAGAGYVTTLATTVVKEEERGGVRLLPLGAADADGAHRLRRIPRNFRAFKVMFGDYDIIHIHDPELLLASFLPSIRGKKLVYDVHEFYHDRFADSHWIFPTFRSFARRAYAWLERLVLPKFAGIVVVSDAMISHYSQFVGPKRVIVVRNFPNLTPEHMEAASRAARPVQESY